MGIYVKKPFWREPQPRSKSLFLFILLLPSSFSYRFLPSSGRVYIKLILGGEAGENNCYQVRRTRTMEVTLAPLSRALR